MVYENMRPPVAAIKGDSPLRGLKEAEQLAEFANGDFTDQSGLMITKNQIV